MDKQKLGVAVCEYRIIQDWPQACVAYTDVSLPEEASYAWMESVFSHN